MPRIGISISTSFLNQAAPQGDMAVYTHLSNTQISDLLNQYDVGDFVSAQPIAEGVENSNYLLTTTQNRFILTLYEKRTNAADLPFFLQLKQHLAQNDILCPQPIARKDGELLSEIAERPAAMVSFLNGKSVRRMNNSHVRELGAAMAKMHLASEGFTMRRQNSLAPDRLNELFETTTPRLNELLPNLREQLQLELASMQKWPSLTIPRGIIHADLFPDNVFFTGDALSGLIDFYFACEDYLAYDLAIAFNAWCFEGNVDFNITKAQHLISAYHHIRPLSDAELDALPFLARGAALRFFFTRAHDWFFPVEGAVVTAKDPVEYLKKWQFHCQAESFRDYIL